MRSRLPPWRIMLTTCLWPTFTTFSWFTCRGHTSVQSLMAGFGTDVRGLRYNLTTWLASASREAKLVDPLSLTVILRTWDSLSMFVYTRRKQNHLSHPNAKRRSRTFTVVNSMKKPAADKTFKDLQRLPTLSWSLRWLHAGPDAISRQTAHQSDWQMMQQQLDWPQEEGGTDGVLQYDEKCPNYTVCANTDWMFEQRDEQRCIIQKLHG